MIIQAIEVKRISVPLKKPFKTALRTVHSLESVLVKITCDNGMVGWGEASATVVITGDSIESIESAILNTMKPQLIGLNLIAYEQVFQTLHQSMVGNTSAKAAVDIALYDLISQRAGMPLYQFLGGYRDKLETDYTVSVNSPKEMGEDAAAYLKEGFHVLKIKVGKDNIEDDILRIQEIRKSVGNQVKIRLDANQGWNVKEAVQSIRKMEDMGLGIELIEQPVKAHDLEGLKRVTDSVDTPIMADESVFSPAQALQVLQNRAADMINIKLMKAGGIFKAQLINQMAEEHGIPCMVGSMIESRLAVSAAAHFAASKKNITRFDFDAPLMLLHDGIDGGVTYEGRLMKMQKEPGLGLRSVSLWEGGK
ncbi:L-Ala-D/L-Glu epimerase [Brevibacillus reuszeri]|uniref:Dipeptide epimerase n=1 Tax=Brevibacillus reuszeri TaxID=54915 RepID=A0A0K9YU09_9BACL|nr:dipeptide epimerase [Brevibacillus reuszeri]KNB72166.1 L-alanine-DL-glutamate epimerase [Brevibacillus reuszeri]MED1859660.1 dipeptide epimerase [Brevibacillus reuszeri]GED72940.1 L-Ala-D/L-Glu epimerase [Brevibacillus reuszeri]